MYNIVCRAENVLNISAQSGEKKERNKPWNGIEIR